MEVCFKCQKPIEEGQKWIQADPDGKRKGWWRYGDWDYSQMRAKPIERYKYHVECFNEEKKYYNDLFKKRLKISLSIAGGMIMFFGLIVAIVLIVIF